MSEILKNSERKEYILKYDNWDFNKTSISNTIENVTHRKHIKTNYNYSDYKQFDFWIMHLKLYNEVLK